MALVLDGIVALIAAMSAMTRIAFAGTAMRQRIARDQESGRQSDRNEAELLHVDLLFCD
jgi:hypothetical protein